MTHTQAQPARQSGFTLVEVALTLVLATLMLYGLHATLSASMSGRRTGDRVQVIHEIATDFLDRVRTLPFGRASDPRASSAQLTELFDDDQEVGTVTLHQVAVPADQAGHSFSVATRGVIGRFRVRVSNDLDGNGEIDGPREGRDDLLHVEIFFDDRLVLATHVAADPVMTRQDAVDYLTGG